MNKQNRTPAPSDALEDEPRQPQRKKSVVREYAEAILVILAIALVIRTFVVHAYRIPSSSMEDTLLIGDFLLANRFVYGSPAEIPFTGIVLGKLPEVSPPKRGDVVIFASWTDTTEDFIKRLVGLPGDTILVVDNELYVNGVEFDNILQDRYAYDPEIFPEIKYAEPYRRPRMIGIDPTNYGPHVVQEGHYFMMGDNRDFSADSRFHGDVPAHRIKARAVIIYLSLDTEKPLWDIFSAIRWDRIGRLIH